MKKSNSIIDQSPPQRSALKPTSLHALLGTATVWTDDLWAEATAWLRKRLSNPQAFEMAYQLQALNAEGPSLEEMGGLTAFKADRLAGFRKYPPTMLLAIYDYSRGNW